MADGTVRLNGVNGATGEYLTPPLPVSRVASLARGRRDDPDTRAWLERVWGGVSRPHLGLPFGVDPADVGAAGWAVVFDVGEPAEVKAAIAPLIEHRAAALGADRVKVLDYRPGESWRDWLDRHHTAPGSVDPAKVPYYLLLLGPPTRIPYSIQFLLDVEYAVGRVAFDDPADYRRYAESLVASEEGAVQPPAREVVLFATRHEFDDATQLSADELVAPLAGIGWGAEGRPAAAQWGFGTKAVIGPEARVERLAAILAGEPGRPPPGLLFTATHGVGWPRGHARQRARQGALVCQDWSAVGAIEDGECFSAADVGPHARVHGTVAFLFACYSAGTPLRDDYLYEPGRPAPEIADEPFVAALPSRLLAHPAGGAVAAIGHVERAWGYSIVSEGGPQLLPFRNMMGALLTGRPVGLAMKDFNERYAALSTNLATLLHEAEIGAVISDQELATAWVERNDAQNLVVLGDPAARIQSGA